MRCWASVVFCIFPAFESLAGESWAGASQAETFFGFDLLFGWVCLGKLAGLFGCGCVLLVSGSG